MKKNMFKQSMIGFALGVATLMAPCAVSAAVPAGVDECARELLLSYFPEPIVTDTLKRFSIPQDKWEGITSTLSRKDKEVVKMVEQKAAAMNPNPLKDPQQRQAAVKLFRETLLQVFSDALKENGITDTSNFQAMLDDIQQQKAKKFAMCMEKQKSQAQQAMADDEDDDGDDEERTDEDGDDDEEDSADQEVKPVTPAVTK